MGSKMKQDKAVTSPQPTPARNADRKWRFDAVFETFTFENGGGQLWHHGVHADIRSDITVSSNAGLKPFLRGGKGGVHRLFADFGSDSGMIHK